MVAIINDFFLPPDIFVRPATISITKKTEGKRKMTSEERSIVCKKKYSFGKGTESVHVSKLHLRTNYHRLKLFFSSPFQKKNTCTNYSVICSECSAFGTFFLNVLSFRFVHSQFN